MFDSCDHFLSHFLYHSKAKQRSLMIALRSPTGGCDLHRPDLFRTLDTSYNSSTYSRHGTKHARWPDQTLAAIMTVRLLPIPPSSSPAPHPHCQSPANKHPSHPLFLFITHVSPNPPRHPNRTPNSQYQIPFSPFRNTPKAASAPSSSSPSAHGDDDSLKSAIDNQKGSRLPASKAE